MKSFSQCKQNGVKKRRTVFSFIVYFFISTCFSYKHYVALRYFHALTKFHFSFQTTFFSQKLSVCARESFYNFCFFETLSVFSICVIKYSYHHHHLITSSAIFLNRICVTYRIMWWNIYDFEVIFSWFSLVEYYEIKTSTRTNWRIILVFLVIFFIRSNRCVFVWIFYSRHLNLFHI